jgi:hypothetical protein
VPTRTWRGAKEEPTYYVATSLVLAAGCVKPSTSRLSQRAYPTKNLPESNSLTCSLTASGHNAFVECNFSWSNPCTGVLYSPTGRAGRTRVVS